MNRIRSLAIGAMLMFVLTTVAQQTITNGPAKARVPTVEEQMKLLTGRLDLTGDQQAKIKPILKQLHDATQKIVDNDSLSPDQRLAQVRPWRYKTDEKIRETLNDDQKKKLDQLEQEPHPELHGELNATPPQS